MRRITLIDRLRYAFDNTLSRGTIALIVWLFVLSAFFILGTAAIVTVTGIAASGKESPDYFELTWRSLLRTLDPGTMGGDTGRPEFLGAMLVVTLGGIFIVSTLIGVLTSGIESKLEELRKGRSFVVEQDHTLILGWSPGIFTVIAELVEANSNRRGACIVILAEKDKVEMEDDIRAKVPNTKGTRIVCRTGSPLDLTDLDIANPPAARSIIVLSPTVGDPDVHVIKTILALTNGPNRKPSKYHIVAEIRDSKNVPVAKMVGREEAEIVLVGDLISRITVQTCRQSGLSVVYTELLNFGGDEIYFKEEPALVGRLFGDALLAYEDSTVIGLHTKDGTTRLQPPMNTRIAPGDQVIAISADDDTVKLSGLPAAPVDASALQAKRPATSAPEHILILGWNRRGSSIVRELDNYVAAGSKTLVVANVPKDEFPAAKMRNQTVTFRVGDTTSRETLDGLAVEKQDHIIVLGYSDALAPQEVDAHTLITLLHLRDMSERARKDFTIVSEMLDVRNRELAEAARADDFIVSDHLISLILAQVSENKHLNAVFSDLFDPEGSEIYLKPVERYVRVEQPLNFYTIVEAARQRNEIAIGYRLERDLHEAAKSYGVVVNPDKSNPIAFGKGDKVIVIAES